MSEDMVVSATGSYAATFTQSKSGNWAALMATFKAAAPPSALIAYVQSANGVSTQSASTVSASFASTTLGNAIIVAASAGPAISSVTDTQNNTYAQAVASGSNAIYYATNIKGGADTITAKFASSSGFSIIYIHEYSGVAANSPLDQTSSQTGTGTAINSGAKTTTQASELIFGTASVDYSVSAAGTGFTKRQTAGGNMSEDMVVSATGSYAATFTQSASGGWTALMATFAAVGTAPPPCTTPTAPTNVAATAVSGSEIDLTWNASTSSCSGITYTVFRSTSSGSTGSQIASGVAGTSYHDTSVSAGTTYYYKWKGRTLVARRVYRTKPAQPL